MRPVQLKNRNVKLGIIENRIRFLSMQYKDVCYQLDNELRKYAKLVFSEDQLNEFKKEVVDKLTGGYKPDGCCNNCPGGKE